MDELAEIRVEAAAAPGHVHGEGLRRVHPGCRCAGRACCSFILVSVIRAIGALSGSRYPSDGPVRGAPGALLHSFDSARPACRGPPHIRAVRGRPVVGARTIVSHGPDQWAERAAMLRVNQWAGRCASCQGWIEAGSGLHDPASKAIRHDKGQRADIALEP
jgi:hypothetical protein